MSPLTIVGASARAAAMSARRAGLDPWCADLFGDADLRAMVPDAVRCPVGQYPHAFLDILADAPAGPWMYTGGLENHPNLIREMSAVRPLWGNGPNALVACRSPFHIQRLLGEAGLPVPEVRAADAELPDYCQWLRKPLSGSAGQGIAFAKLGERAATSPTGSQHHFFQQFVSGPSMSAVYVRARGDVRFIGVSEQLIGIDWLNAPPFRYAGNVGPIAMSPEVRHDLVRIGHVLGEGCGLLGVYGVDFVLHAGRPWVVEVNPRYPASVEVFELTTGPLVLPLHAAAFDAELRTETRSGLGGAVAAKAVLYAARRVVVPRYESIEVLHRIGISRRCSRGSMTIHLADIPAAGEVIESGWPVLSVLVVGDDRGRCLDGAKSAVERIKNWLDGTRPPQVIVGTWYQRLDDPAAD